LRAGLQIVGWLPQGMEDVLACAAAAQDGVSSVPLSALTLERTLPPGLVLGVASAGARAIRQGVERLGGALRQLQQR
jgi:GntR family transcriptional regulator/MocR family aminotransferase